MVNQRDIYFDARRKVTFPDDWKQYAGELEDRIVKLVERLRFNIPDNTVELLRPRLELDGYSHQLEYKHRLYTLAFSAPDDVTFTIPADTKLKFEDGTIIRFYQEGNGQVTVAGASSVTIYSAETKKLRRKYSGGELTKLKGNTWLLVGDLELT